MKTKIVHFSLAILLIFTSYLGYASFTKSALNKTELLLQPSKGSTEELYQDIMMSLMAPYISDVLYGYYGKSYSHDPWDIRVKSIERPNGYRTYLFKITLEVSPYVGAHNSVGIDELTFIIEGSGDVELVDYKHLKDYPIPEHLRDDY